MDRDVTNTVISNRNTEKGYCPLAAPGQKKNRSNEAFRLRFLDLLIVVKMDGKQYGTCIFAILLYHGVANCSTAVMQ